MGPQILKAPFVLLPITGKAIISLKALYSSLSIHSHTHLVFLPVFNASEIALLITLSCTDMLLDDFLVAENSLLQSEINSPSLTSEGGSPITNPKVNHSNINSHAATPSGGGPEIPPSGGMG